MIMVLYFFAVASFAAGVLLDVFTNLYTLGMLFFLCAIWLWLAGVIAACVEVFSKWRTRYQARALGRISGTSGPCLKSDKKLVRGCFVRNQEG